MQYNQNPRAGQVPELTSFSPRWSTCWGKSGVRAYCLHQRILLYVLPVSTLWLKCLQIDMAIWGCI